MLQALGTIRIQFLQKKFKKVHACVTAARSRQDSRASPVKKLGRKLATPPSPNHLKKCSKIYVYKVLDQFLPIIVKIKPQIGNLELGHFLGR
jgi:hypothetical protein